MYVIDGVYTLVYKIDIVEIFSTYEPEVWSSWHM